MHNLCLYVYTLVFECQQEDFKQQELPLARIKKIMKLDEDVKVCVLHVFVLHSTAIRNIPITCNIRVCLICNYSPSFLCFRII